MVKRSRARGLSRVLQMGVFALLSSCGGGAGHSSEAECKVGTVGCACGPSSHCNEGLLCDEGTCHGEGAVGLSISDPRARACEVLLVDKGAHVLDVAFEADVQGTHVREAPNTALSFISRSDAPVPSGAVQVKFAEGKGAAPEVSVVHCSDAQGAPLAGVKVIIRG